MRIQHWLIPILGALLVVSSGRTGMAQDRAIQGAAPHGYSQMFSGESRPAVADHELLTSEHAPDHTIQPAQYTAATPIYQPGEFGEAVGPDPMAHYGFPPPATAWPNISPYDHQFSEHINHKGLWFHDFNDRGRQFFFGAEYLLIKSRRPGSHLVGHGPAQTYLDMVEPTIREDVDDGLADDFREGFNYFDRQRMNVLGHFRSPGLRLRFGMLNPDESGWEGAVWWGMNDINSWSARKELGLRFGERVNPRLDPTLRFMSREIFEQILSPPDFFLTDTDPLDTPKILEAGLANLRGLPLDNGSFGGVTVPYDVDYILKASSQSWGAHLHTMMTPVVKGDQFLVRPVVGVRYLNLREGFRFFGHDSGVLYDNNADIADPPLPDLKLHSLPLGTDFNGDGIIDTAGIVQGGGPSETETDEAGFRLVTEPFKSYLRNKTRSHMAGPELGLRYDVGGDEFRVWGQSKFALLANAERIQMEGNNIGFGIRPGVFVDPTPQDPRPNAFEDERRHTHISPMFEQSVFVEAPLFRHVPLVRKVHALQAANFRAGYTYIVVGNVARPFDTIVWRGDPGANLFPGITVNRGNWHTSNWSFSVDWQF